MKGLSRRDRNFRPNFDGRLSLPIGTNQALACKHCKAAVVAEVTTSIYDLGQYVEGKKLIHRHSADPETVGEVLERIATERRLLEERDPNDYEYSVEGKKTRN